MKIEPEYQERLERLIDLELKQLPEPQAPEPLFERVMRAIEEDQRKSWWQKPWSCWPTAIQGLFISTLAVFAGSLVYGLSLAPTDAPAQWFETRFAGTYALFSASASALITLTNALLLVFTAVFSSWVLIAIVAAAFLYASSFALGLAWFRVALNRRAFTFKLL
jgi:hypothetical protein